MYRRYPDRRPRPLDRAKLLRSFDIVVIDALIAPREVAREQPASRATLDGCFDQKGMVCMTRVLLCMWMLALGGSSAASAQTTGAGYADALTPSLANVAKAMIARTIRRALPLLDARRRGSFER